MKLETTLEERPGFLHALPFFDLFMLVTILLLLSPMFLSQSGITIEVPTSRFQMQRYPKSIVVTVGPGGRKASLYLGRESITLDELPERLSALKLDDDLARAIILLKTDIGTSVGMERLVSEMILGASFEMALVGRAETREDDLQELNPSQE
ncbi:MAG: biopolymer transporter ExbD [Luteolibacter sp.]